MTAGEGAGAPSRAATDARTGVAVGAPRHPYRTIDVPVAGGALRVAIWDAVGPRTADMLLVHGITSSHLAWPFVVDALPPGVHGVLGPTAARLGMRFDRPPAMPRRSTTRLI